MRSSLLQVGGPRAFPRLVSAPLPVGSEVRSGKSKPAYRNADFPGIAFARGRALPKPLSWRRQAARSASKGRDVDRRRPSLEPAMTVHARTGHGKGNAHPSSGSPLPMAKEAPQRPRTGLDCLGGGTLAGRPATSSLHRRTAGTRAWVRSSSGALPQTTREPRAYASRTPLTGKRLPDPA